MTFGEAIKASNENSPSGVNSIAPGQVAFHIIGAYLNILGGGGAKIAPEAMTVERLQTIWAEYASTLHYKPIANGLVWNGEAIVAYLISNGIVK